jgi:hypothetical protein
VLFAIEQQWKFSTKKKTVKISVWTESRELNSLTNICTNQNLQDLLDGKNIEVEETLLLVDDMGIS